jgi:hypothetical protein
VAKAKESVDNMNTFIYKTLADGDAEQGLKNFKILSEWCTKNMPEGKRVAINKLLASGDTDLVVNGLQQAVNAWKAGKEKPMMTGDSPTKPEVKETIKPLSKDEFISIMKTKKYQDDPDYAAKIDARRQWTIDNHGVAFQSPEYSSARPVVY